MKSFSRFSLLVFFLIGLSAATAFAQGKTVDPKDVEELKKIYKEFDESTVKLDIKPVEKYLDSKYELQNGESKLKRAVVIRGVKNFFATVEEIDEATATIEKVEVADGNYFLEVYSIIRGKMKLPDGKVVPFESISKSTDIWKKTKNGWKENKQIVRSLVQSVDGK